MKVTIQIPDDTYILVEPILKGLQAIIGKDFKMSTTSDKPKRRVNKHPEDMSKREIDQYLEGKLNKKYGH